MTTATVHMSEPTRKDSITLDSWNGILFLVQEPDRHGTIVWNVRLIIGDLPPQRYGPFFTKKAAREAFSTIAPFVNESLSEMFNEAGNQAHCDGNDEF